FDPNFQVNAEGFADLQVLRYEVPGWDQLSAQQKELAYYLYEASLAGRDIIYDQRGKHNLTVRKTIETIWGSYKGEKSGEDWDKFKTYAGQVWFSNGIHHHYSNDKFKPEFSFEYFQNLVQNSDTTMLPLADGETVAGFLGNLKKVIFDANYMPKMVNLSAGIDNVVHSANNFYEGVSHKEVDAFYDKFPKSDHEPEWGLNSKTTKENGVVVEKVWKSGGMYTAAIDKIIYWLKKAVPLAENEQQKKAFQLLIEYYETGDLKKWDEYSIAWTQNTSSVIDFTNGF